jgi:hypothetical protein
MKKWKADNLQASETTKRTQRKNFRRQWDSEKAKDPEFGGVFLKKKAETTQQELRGQKKNW